MTEEMKADEIYTWSEYCEKAAIDSRLPGAYSRGVDHTNFTGGTSFDEAMEMATVKGYQAAIPQIEQTSHLITNTVFKERPVNSYEVYHDVSGGEVDIAMYLADVPECMIEVTPTTVSKFGRVIRLVVNVGYRAEINSQTIMDRGAAIVALVDLMARSQHPVEIWAVNRVQPTASNPRGAKTILVKVLDANEPLDIGRIAFAVAHPAMLRRLMFSHREQWSPEEIKRFHIPTGYGASADVAASEYPEAIVLPRLDSNRGWDKDSAVRWIEKEMDRIFT